jgi:hypothetical protein
VRLSLSGSDDGARERQGRSWRLILYVIFFLALLQSRGEMKGKAKGMGGAGMGGDMC